MNKYAMIREYVYGWDFTEFGDDEQIVLYNTMEEGLQELNQYIEDVEYAFLKGDMISGYDNDCFITEVFEDDNGKYYFKL